MGSLRRTRLLKPFDGVGWFLKVLALATSLALATVFASLGTFDLTAPLRFLEVGIGADDGGGALTIVEDGSTCALFAVVTTRGGGGEGK
jgi:hypothetical protein